MKKPVLLAGIFIACMATKCDQQSQTSTASLETKSDLAANGKLLNANILGKVYTPTDFPTFDLPVIDGGMVEALENQLQLLKTFRQRSTQKVGNLTVNLDELEKVVLMLREWQFTKPLDLVNELDAHQIKGEDGKGNVRFTGYFTPVLKAKTKPDADFKYPIYKQPKNWVGPLPTRREIDREKALDGRDLVIAYANNLVDVYNMHVQGSGFIKFPNGKTTYLAYDGTNRHPYRSVAKFLMNSSLLPPGADISISGIRTFLKNAPHLQDSVLFSNPSYTFFRPKGGKPLGSAGVPVTASYSIAVDRRVIPLGSVLLAAVPHTDKNGKVIGHEYRFLLAQDIGGQIDGPGHVDVYTGIGAEAEQKASDLHHYGRMWLLLPKART